MRIIANGRALTGLFLLLALLAGFGCKAPELKGGERRFYFGFVALSNPRAHPPRPDFVHRGVTCLGFSAASDGLQLGLAKRKEAFLPTDSSMLIYVHDAAQFAALTNFLQSIHQTNICVIQDKN